MIRHLNIGFARLTIDTATNTGSVNLGHSVFPVTTFEYVALPGLGQRENPKVRFEIVQDVPGMVRSPFKAAIEADIITDHVVPSLEV